MRSALPRRRTLGLPPEETAASLAIDHARGDCLYTAAMDITAMNDPATLDIIAGDFPAVLPQSDIHLILVECIANAVLHGAAQGLGLSVRRRERVLLVTFYQTPPMPHAVKAALSRGRTGWLPDYAAGPPGGLGFPILLRLSRRITVSTDYRGLRLWFRGQSLRPR